MPSVVSMPPNRITAALEAASASLSSGCAEGPRAAVSSPNAAAACGDGSAPAVIDCTDSTMTPYRRSTVAGSASRPNAWPTTAAANGPASRTRRSARPAASNASISRSVSVATTAPSRSCTSARRQAGNHGAPVRVVDRRGVGLLQELAEHPPGRRVLQVREVGRLRQQVEAAVWHGAVGELAVGHRDRVVAPAPHDLGRRRACPSRYRRSCALTRWPRTSITDRSVCRNASRAGSRQRFQRTRDLAAHGPRPCKRGDHAWVGHGPQQRRRPGQRRGTAAAG